MKNKKINKTSLLISIANNQSYDNFFSSSKCNFLSNMNELNDILKDGDSKIISFLYFFRRKISKILYNNEEIININSNIINKRNISDYFYLSLLIKDDPNIINYIYSIDIIKELNDLLKVEKDNNNLKKLIISKIGIDLINNYKNSDNFDESETELINIEKFFLENIKKNITNVGEFDINFTVNQIITEKIDFLYIKIILYLLKQIQFGNYEYIFKILEQINLENIKLTEIMLDNLINELSKDEFKLKYQINDDKNDGLLDEKKIYFYFFLFKYILKDKFFIYQIEFLKRARKIIISYIKNKKFLKINNKYIDYIIENLVDSEYYMKIYNFSSKPINNDNNVTNSTSLNNNQNGLGFNNSTNFNNTNNETLEIKDEKALAIFEEFMEKILNKSTFLLKSDKEKKISIVILNDEEEEIEKKKLKIRKKKINKIENDNQILFKNFEKFLEFLFNVKEEIKKQFRYNYNLLIKMKFNQEYINNNSNSIYNITCRYNFIPLNDDRLSSFIDENILVNGLNQGFPFLINEINDYNYKGIEYDKSLNINKIIKEKEDIENKYKKKEKEETVFSDLDIVNSKEISEYDIIKFKKIIASHSNSADFLYKLSNGYYASGGNQREIYIYDEKFNKIEVNLKYKPNGICEIKYHDNKNILKIITYSYEYLSLISYESHKNSRPSIYDYRISANNILELERNNYIINNEIAGYKSQNFADKNYYEKIFNYTYYVGIKINEKLSAFTSNRVMPNGKDRLIIYNFISGEIDYEIEGYSFSLSQNSLLLIKIKDSLSEDKILICACKKYSSYQKNGILLVNTRIKDNQDIFDAFYETYYFEPYCFSQILLINNSTENKKKSGEIYDTNYFFVGGFDQERGIGAIKLYKINFEYQAYNTTIRYIQDINFERFFNGAITSIVQARNTGNFLISCSNGNIYLFSMANINFYLFYDKEIAKEADYENMQFYDKVIKSQIEKEKRENKKQKLDNYKMFKELLVFLRKEISFNLDFFD